MNAPGIIVPDGRCGSACLTERRMPVCSDFVLLRCSQQDAATLCRPRYAAARPGDHRRCRSEPPAVLSREAPRVPRPSTNWPPLALVKSPASCAAFDCRRCGAVTGTRPLHEPNGTDTCGPAASRPDQRMPDKCGQARLGYGLNPLTIRLRIAGWAEVLELRTIHSSLFYNAVRVQ